MVREVRGGYRQQRDSFRAALALTLPLILLGAEAAADITVTTVVDTTATPIDGGWGTPPAIRNGHVAFMAHSASGPNPGALYRWNAGTLEVVIDTSTPVPGGGGTFQANDFAVRAPVDADGNTVLTVRSFTSTPAGVYDTSSGSLQVVANTSTTIPGTALQFDTFNTGNAHGASIDAGKVAFVGFHNPSLLQGVYTNVNGSLEKVVDTSTLIPGTATAFNAFGGLDISGSTVAFPAGGFDGVWAWDATSGTLTTVADETTPCLSGGGTFDSFGQGVDVEGDAVVFVHSGGSCGGAGIYTNAGGSLELVADTTTATPGGSGTLLIGETISRGAAIDAGRVVFCARDSVSLDASIFMWEESVLSRLFGEGDSLGGATLIALGLPGTCSAALGWNSLSGDKLAFLGIFDDGREGVFVANLAGTPSVPILPSVFWLLTAALIGIGIARIRWASVSR